MSGEEESVQVALVSWIVGSGQISPVAVGQTLRFPLEAGPQGAWEPRPGAAPAVHPVHQVDGRQRYVLTGRVLSASPRLTVLDAGLPVLVSGRVTTGAGPVGVGDVVRAEVTLGVDPYVGRVDPRRPPEPDLTREWVVEQIVRVTDEARQVVETTEAPDETRIYHLTVRAGLARPAG